jgi:hypothetical protein
MLLMELERFLDIYSFLATFRLSGTKQGALRLPRSTYLKQRYTRGAALSYRRREDRVPET